MCPLKIFTLCPDIEWGIASSKYDCRAYFLVSYWMSNICSWHSYPSSRKIHDKHKVSSIMSYPIESESEAHALQRWPLQTLPPSWGRGMSSWRRTMHWIPSSMLLNMPRNHVIPTPPCTRLSLSVGLLSPSRTGTPSQSPRDGADLGIYNENLQGCLPEELLLENFGVFLNLSILTVILKFEFLILLSNS